MPLKYCQQCSVEHNGVDLEDFEGRLTLKEHEDGYTLPVVCDGCGIVCVDPNGKCVDKDCEKHNMRRAHGQIIQT